MKKQPIIKEILLGKKIEEVITEHFSEVEFEVYSTEDQLPDIIREVIRIDKSDLKFAVDVAYDACSIFVLNDDSNLRLEDYWDDEGNYARTDDASADCEALNNIVDALYGTERKRAKPKITKDQFVKKKGNVCPYCLKTKIIVLDAETWNDRDEMGCQSCGATWDRKYKTVVTGFI